MKLTSPERTAPDSDIARKETLLKVDIPAWREIAPLYDVVAELLSNKLYLQFRIDPEDVMDIAPPDVYATLLLKITI